MYWHATPARLLSCLAAFLVFGSGVAVQAETVHGNAADDLRWASVSDSGGDRLVFGAPGTDEIYFGLSCRPGSGKVELANYGAFDSPGGGAPKALTLTSADRRKTLDKLVVSDPLSDEVRKASVSLDEPLIAAFKRTGRLGVALEGAADAYSAASTSERAEIERFFSGCAARA